MRTFEQYIREAVDFRLGGKARNGMREQNYKYFPSSVTELQNLMTKLIDERANDDDFNDIDVSKIKDLSYLFVRAYNFNGDISEWDTSNVTTMSCMFRKAEKFNQDISLWDTSKVIDMNYMFCWAESFNQDISRWDTSNVENMKMMFYECPIKDEYKPSFK